MVVNMQPPRLPVSETDRRRRYQTKMEPGCNNARPDAGPEGDKTKPNASHSGQGLEIKEKFLHFRSRAKNVLDIPSYRSGVYTCNRSVTSVIEIIANWASVASRPIRVVRAESSSSEVLFFQFGLPVTPCQRKIITWQVTTPAGLDQASERKVVCMPPLHSARFGGQCHVEIGFPDRRWKPVRRL
jgi:hypothetical protein